MQTVEIDLYGVPLTVVGIYTPEEPGVDYTQDMDGYPGSPAEFEVYEVLAGEVDIRDILIWDQIDEITALTLEKL